MALQITGAAQIKVYSSVNGQLVINVWGAQVTGTVTFGQALADQVGTIVKQQWTTQMAPLCPSTSSVVRVGVRDLRQPNLPEWRDTGAAVAGTGTGDALPASLACCVTLRTAGAGKSFRGRSYVTGFNEGQNGPSGLILAGASAGAVNWLNNANGQLTPLGLPLGVLSYPSEEKIITETTNHSNGTTTTRTLSHTRAKVGQVNRITAFESRNSFWEQQRRRNNGRGAAPTSLFAQLSVPVAPVTA